MTPEEMEILEEQRKKKVEALRSFKDTNGYGVLCEIIRNQFTACVTEKLNNDKPEDQAQIDANMRAWNVIGKLIDFEIQSYDHMVYQRLQQQGG